MDSQVSFSGSMVALVTPMTDQGEICYSSLESLIDWHIDSSTNALVILGTTGEASLLNEQEYFRVCEFTLEKCHGRIPVILGCGGVSTAKTVDFAKKLAELKPDAFLSVTPYYIKPTQEGMVEHFTQIADATDIPVILYNVPGRTGVDLLDETVVKLSTHKNIVGLKDATGDIARAEFLASKLNDFALLSGDDETAFEFIKAGGDGAISVTANIAPNEMSLWLNGCLNKAKSVQKITEVDLTEELDLFQRLMPLHRNLFVEANPIPVKWALWKLGKIKQGIRLPLIWLKKSNQAKLEEALISSQIIEKVE